MQVVSGGVASNSYLRSWLQELTQHYQLDFHAPPPKLCTDNGIISAWVGMEHLIALQAGDTPPRETEERGAVLPYTGVCWSYLDKLNVTSAPQLPLGRDLSKAVEAQRIKVKRDRLKGPRMSWAAEKGLNFQMASSSSSLGLLGEFLASSRG